MPERAFAGTLCGGVPCTGWQQARCHPEITAGNGVWSLCQRFPFPVFGRAGFGPGRVLERRDSRAWLACGVFRGLAGCFSGRIGEKR